MITIKSPREIETMAAAGRIVAETLALVGRSIRPDITTEDLDQLAESFIRSHPGAQPSFKGLYDFPATLCTSINQEIVHGIPSHKRVLHDGDIVSIDVGVWLEGLHADSAATFPVGDVQPAVTRLLHVTQQALAAGVAQARAGNHVGDIGHAVQQVAEQAGYSVVRELVGHGIGTSFHEEPQVPNYGKPKRGPRLVPGMTIAIEPMINIGGSGIRTLDDKWTVVTQDGSLSAHFEHTVAVTDNGPRILTTAEPSPDAFARAGSDIPARFAFTFSEAPSIAVFASIPATRASLMAFLFPICSMVWASARRRRPRLTTTAGGRAAASNASSIAAARPGSLLGIL